MNINCTLGGFFKFEATNSETGEKRLLSDWQKNLITELGLERIGIAGSVIGRVQVGSGQAVPNINDTQLAAFVGETSTGFGSDTFGASSTEPYYGFARRTFRFPLGGAAGNLSEVGILTASGHLFSRSLIRDINGNPTTITVLPNEFLDVTYELRIHAPTADVTSQFTLDGNTYDCVVRAAQAGNAGFWATTIHTFGASGLPGFGLGSAGVAAFTGDIGTRTQGPSGTSASSTPSQLAYAANSRYIEVNADFALDTANFPGGIRSIRFGSNIGCYQAQFTPAIPKDNLRTLRLTVRHHWARQP